MDALSISDICQWFGAGCLVAFAPLALGLVYRSVTGVLHSLEDDNDN